MCGIYGITENNPNIIRKMINVCSHRGPDGSNTFNNDFLTLGHNLLSITSTLLIPFSPGFQIAVMY